MRQSHFRVSGLMSAVLLACCLAPSARANDALVVHIECTGPEGQTTQGSGVLVSEKGHVLTARHVAPEGFTCQAVVGNSSKPKRGLRQSFQSNKINGAFDALLMEFGRDADEKFPFSTVCAVTDDLKGRDIIAKGFHSGSFGPPSATDGILSNTYIRPDGVVETTAMTVNGKSGGPVFLKGTDNILGIIVGAEFNATGVVSYYGMLATDAVLDDLDMFKRSETCIEIPIGPTPKPEETLANTLVAAAPKPAPADNTQSTGAPEPATQADPNFPESVTGYNVSYIEYDRGHFKQIGPEAWVLHDPFHNVLGEFYEVSRDEWSMMLANDFTGFTIQFDGLNRMIYQFLWGEPNYQAAITAVK